MKFGWFWTPTVVMIATGKNQYDQIVYRFQIAWFWFDWESFEPQKKAYEWMECSRLETTRGGE